jgi:hypothetical protein
MGKKVNNPVNTFCVKSRPVNTLSKTKKIDDEITFIYCNELPKTLTEEKVKKAVLNKLTPYKVYLDVLLLRNDVIVLTIHHTLPTDDKLPEFIEKRLLIYKTIINYFLP